MEGKIIHQVSKNGHFWRRKWTFLDKRTAFRIWPPQLLCILAPFYFNWPAFWLGVAMYLGIGTFGITLSYHRNLSHKSFKLPKCLEYLFAYVGVMAFQGDPIDWVSTHRYHHQFTETERDPHSPNVDGFWYSHMGWYLDSYTATKKLHPEYVGDFQDGETKNILKGNLKYGKSNNVKDLEKQMFYRFIHKTYILHPLAMIIALYALGGLPYLIWGAGIGVTCVLHSSCLVNSVCHIWGKRQWKTNDLSKNNWWVALLTSGEGWHNNHHAFEYSARHGLEWWQIDITWYIIKILQTLRLATHVKLPTKKQKVAKAIPILSYK